MVAWLFMPISEHIVPSCRQRCSNLSLVVCSTYTWVLGHLNPLGWFYNFSTETSSTRTKKSKNSNISQTKDPLIRVTLAVSAAAEDGAG